MYTPIPSRSIVTIHKLANSGHDYTFKTKNGRVEYDAMGYSNNASGNWVLVSRMTNKGVVVRRLHADTLVVVISINNR